MPYQKYISSKSDQQGVVLIEAMLAILIFSFAILGIVGLQAAMVKNTSDSKYRVDASYLAQEAVGSMWSDTNNIPVLIANSIDLSAQLPKGKLTVTNPGGATQFTVTVEWQEPGKDLHQVVINAAIAGI